jgi:hypothetical protein
MAKQMSKTTKIAVAGGLAVAGYFLWQHFQASAQITATAATGTPVIANANGTTTAIPPGVPVEQVIAPTPVTATAVSVVPAGPTTSTMLTALLQWGATTKNPALYTQMMNLLTADQIAALYDILENQWLTGTPATAAHTSFWNTLRAQYPFLNSGGVGCNNLACN